MKDFLKRNIFYFLMCTPIFLAHLPLWLGSVLVFFVYTPFYIVCACLKNVKQSLYFGAFVGFFVHLILISWCAWPQDNVVLIFILVAMYSMILWTLNTVLSYFALHSKAPWLVILVFPIIEAIQLYNPIFNSAYLQTTDIVCRNLFLAQWNKIFGYVGWSILICASSYFFFMLWRQHRIQCTKKKRLNTISRCVKTTASIGGMFLPGVLADFGVDLFCSGFDKCCDYFSQKDYNKSMRFLKILFVFYIVIVVILHSVGAYWFFTVPAPSKKAKIAIIQEYVTKDNWQTLWKKATKNHPDFVLFGEDAFFGCILGKLDSEFDPNHANWIEAAEKVYTDDRYKFTPSFMQRLLKKTNSNITVITGLELFGYEEATPIKDWSDKLSLIKSLPYQTSIAVITKDNIQITNKRIAAPLGERPLTTILPFLKYIMPEKKQRFRAGYRQSILKLKPDVTIAACVCYEHIFPYIWYQKGLKSMENIAFQEAHATTIPVGQSKLEHYESESRRIYMATAFQHPYLYIDFVHSQYIAANGVVKEQAGKEDVLVWDIEF